MACNGDHMNPTCREKDSVEICKHLVFLEEENDQTIPRWARDGADNIYGSGYDFDKQVETLCSMLKETHEDFIYNGKNPRARKLADWWDKHKEADKRKADIALAKKNLNKRKQEAYDALLTQGFSEEELLNMKIIRPK
jgi:hypothetical protein